MALTRELITANAALSGLTDEQISAITTLSQNDENTVIGQRIGEVYREIDTRIASATGISRNGDEKTYLYVERAAKALKEQAVGVSDLKKQVGDLTKEKTRLEKAISDGSTDAETKKALTQAQKDLAAITNQYNDLKGEYDTAKANYEKELFGVRVENALGIATSDVKFKSELPASVTGVLLSQATEKIKGMNPEYIDDGKGGKVLVFKDETGAIMRNPENQLNPYTPSELLQRELKALGVLDEGRKQHGGGTNPPVGASGVGSGASIDVSGVKTRVEAYDAIAANLMAQGMTVGTEQFDNAMSTSWKDNNISSLPEK